MQKNLYTIALSLFIATAVFAQNSEPNAGVFGAKPKVKEEDKGYNKINFRGDTMLVDGEPYALVKVSGGSYEHFSVSTLAGEEVILAEPKLENDKLALYELMFLPTAKNSTWRVPKQDERDIKDYKTAFMRQLYLSQVMDTNGLRDGGVKYFIDNASTVEEHHNKFMARPRDPRRVKRDKTASVQVVAFQIKQDAELIAVYEDTEVITKRGTRFKGYKVALPDGTVVAEVMLSDEHAKRCVIITKFDRHEHTVSVENHKFAMWSVADFLIQNEYL